MNNKAQKGVIGFALLVVGFLFIITSFATIDPLKENLDVARNSTSLNCPGVTGFNETDYDDDTDFERSVRRPVCFVTGLSMVYFIGSFLIAVLVWIVVQWRRLT